MDKSAIITYLDFLIAPFYILIILLTAVFIQKKNIKKNVIYKYFTLGLIAKMIGAISLCFIYVYYYKEGGDTLNYHCTGQAFVNLLLQSPTTFFNVWLSPPTPENYYYFNETTGYPLYWNDVNTINVAKFIVPLEFISFKRYLLTSLLMAVISYTGMWKLYLMFCEQYPALYKKFSLSVLFIPSVVFWGSGILKDSWTIAATCWYSYSFYRIFINRQKLILHVLTIVLSAFILIAIKPYIFVALLPGSVLWGMWGKITGIKNFALRIMSVPIIATIGIGGGLAIWSIVSSEMGQFSNMDSMIQKAHASSEDLKQEYYKGNSFDLGSYEPTLEGVMSKFPIATVTGLFRPFVWEANNIVMVLSGLENLIILGFVFFVLLRKPITAITNLFKNPLVLFCLIFAVFFAFSVAISTSNFGAMVRLRIPLMPFLLSGFVLTEYAEYSVKSIRINKKDS